MNCIWKIIQVDKLYTIWQLPERRVHRPTPFLQTKIVDIKEEPALGATSIHPLGGRTSESSTKFGHTSSIQKIIALVIFENVCLNYLLP